MMLMKTKSDQRGMASIMVAAVVMILMSLITLGFARIMGREQRQALDRQLSTQAFYAAESAVNDARAAVSGGTTTAKPDCDVSSGQPYAQNEGIIDAAANIRYTCLIVNPVVPSLEYDNGSINENVPHIGRVESSNGAVIDQIRLGWEGTTSAMTAFGACGAQNNPVATLWAANRPALLRVDIIPAGALNRDALINNTRSLYLYPCAGVDRTIVLGTAAGEVNPNGNNRFNVGCTAGRSPRDCTITVGGLAGAFNSSRFYVRLSTFYRPANVSVLAADSAGTSVPLRNGQVLIDATGRSNDIVRRILVRVPVADDGGITNAGVSSVDSFCKLFTLSRNAANAVTVPENPPC